MGRNEFLKSRLYLKYQKKKKKLKYKTNKYSATGLMSNVNTRVICILNLVKYFVEFQNLKFSDQSVRSMET